jgi:8-oxo-dGTP pyrophosphatase MutT (NUDIX family)
LIREIREETGIDISDQQSDLKFFGYNIVTSNAAKVQDRFLQLRYILLHKQESADLSLHTGSEDKHQTYPDQIKFVKAVDLSIALTMIPWLNNSNELSSFYKFIQSNI